MNRQELIAKLCEDAQITKKQANEVVTSFTDAVTETLQKNEKLSLVGFGTFKVAERKARKGVNPSTGKEIQIPARKVPVFKPGKKLKESI